MIKKVAIIGGGAAGFFTAINLAELRQDIAITLYEGSNKLLAKVLVSGGGRCNVTNRIEDPKQLAANYPRGNEMLQETFSLFGSKETKEWFTKRGISLKTEEDGRVFPQSNTSSTIFQYFTATAKRLGITVKLGERLNGLKVIENGWQLQFKNTILNADAVVLATGSNPSILQLLQNEGIKMVLPVPSLFTFNAKKHDMLDLAGLSVPAAFTHIKEVKGSKENGPLLITHWGFSAPSILKLSAWYARELADLNYNFTLIVNWNQYDRKTLKIQFEDHTKTKAKDKVYSWKDHNLPKRLWQRLFAEAGFKEYINWSEIGKKGIERLLNVMCAYPIEIGGKSTFKEEFVTAGGIDLCQLNPKTFALHTKPNFYAVGEVLNIDAVTGGFNFQAAWSGGYLAAKSISCSV